MTLETLETLDNIVTGIMAATITIAFGSLCMLGGAYIVVSYMNSFIG